MSRLNDPETFFTAPERVLKRAPAKIIKNRRKSPLHPDEIRRLIYERSKEAAPVTTPYKGWIIKYWDSFEPGPPKSRTTIVYVKDPDGTTRPATYNDVIAIRDMEMELYGYARCWLRMKTGDDDR